MTGHKSWLDHNISSRLLSLPKELLLEIITSVALESTNTSQLFPTSLIEFSQCCKYLYHLVHNDPWRLQTLWLVAFHHRFDTAAIYRRRLNYKLNWQAVLERRCKALYQCRSFANKPNEIERLSLIDWEVIWDMISEHDQYNIPHLLNYQVQFAAGIAFQLGPFRDREVYPVVLPILSLLVNYDFSITQFFHQKDNTALISDELSQFAYNFDADALISQHTPLRDFHSWSKPLDQSNCSVTPTFYPAQDPLASAFHLFFATIFASHPNIYQAIPGCVPIPLFTMKSEIFDVEFLRRYERNLFFSSLQESRQGWEEKQQRNNTIHAITPLHNIYADSGFASASHFVSEAHLIEGEWMGYYTFQDPDDNDQEDQSANQTDNDSRFSNSDVNEQQQQQNNDAMSVTTMEDWFDGPMRLTIKIVPLEDASGEPINQSSWLSRWLDEDTHESMTEPRKKRKITSTPTIHNEKYASRSYNHTEPKDQFPSKHLRTCPLTRFEGTGVDNLGTFSISGLVDDTEEGQVTWEKNYVDSGETWEYSGRFVWPMGLCGRWGDEEYGGPWWMWKISDNEAVLPATNVPITK